MARILSSISGGRGRLPVWVARIRSFVLRFMLTGLLRRFGKLLSGSGRTFPTPAQSYSRVNAEQALARYFRQTRPILPIVAGPPTLRSLHSDIAKSLQVIKRHQTVAI
jgi:hypothetical protein